VQRAVEHFADSLTDKVVRILVDNTTALHTISKGRSASFDVNTCVHKVLAKLKRAAPRGVLIDYIHTSRNPADAESRGKTFTGVDSSSVAGLWGVGRGIPVC